MEQKNWTLVRRLVGHDRYKSRAALGQLNMLYTTLRHYVNFFQPTMKLVSKSRNGAKVHKTYDTAKTPYQRLQESGVLTAGKRAELAAVYNGLNPVQLLTQLNGHLEKLWKLAEAPVSTPSRRAKVKEKACSVTDICEATTSVR